MAENPTIIQVLLSNGITAELTTQGNNLLLHMEAATNLKERMFELALDSFRETFQSVD